MITRTAVRPQTWRPGYKEKEKDAVPEGHAPAAPPPADAEGDANRPAVAPVSPLLRFLLILAVASGLTCVYLWQLSTVTEINYETVDLQSKIRHLERQNVSLMLEVADQQAPSEIERQARAQGMEAVATPVYVPLGQGAVVTSTYMPIEGSPAPAGPKAESAPQDNVDSETETDTVGD